ncbi:hypothetical protein Spith_1707 [Spirochaeta thermophila DSM 6578]|uniref:Uncharacterized protein n=1 Tax=Winmispira thermophila (strain ATCC 700085 / DSM 6578 / Z-1203) TaxID=869211 RepID=G0GBV6_WINT7|nr:hypothetical protein [Spirochaeta thermophila]AEJ61967.1 hypothetical protein Spith_1707 [Spirochaeta thermophila DSM 6578]
MKRTILLPALLFALSVALPAEDLTGTWRLQTQVIQVIRNGQVLGFANPEQERSISRIQISGDSATIVFGEISFSCAFRQEGRYLLFRLPDQEANIVITVIPLRSGGYKFSYCLAPPREGTPVSGAGSSTLINFIGNMVEEGS